MIPVTVFDDRFITEKPVLIDEGSVLELTPMVKGEPGEAELIVSASVARQRVELARLRPISVTPAQAGNGYAEVLRQRNLIDLGEYEGKRMSFKLEWAGVADDRWRGVSGLRLRSGEGKRAPDILLICSDAHRYDYSLGTVGRWLMPQLEEFAAQSVTYESAYAPASWTLPSIASLHTGLWPRYHQTGRRVGSYDGAEFDPKESVPGTFAVKWDRYRILTTFPESLPTLQGVLSGNGYTTAIVSANFLYHLSGLSLRGFDLAETWSGAPGDVLNRSAERIIRSQPGQEPLFLLVHYTDVHDYARDSPNSERMTDGRIPADQRRPLWRAAYEEAVKSSDQHLGKLLETWDAARGLDNTLVVLYADHGESLMDRAETSDDWLVRHGNSMDDTLLRVPLVVSYPGFLDTKPHTVMNPVSLLDIFPTILDICELNVDNASLQGFSLLKAEAEDRERNFFADYQMFGHSLGSVRAGAHKMVFDFDRTHDSMLECDDGLCRPLPLGPNADQYRAELGKIYREYTKSAEEASSGLKSQRSVDQDEVLRELRSLGYIH